MPFSSISSLRITIVTAAILFTIVSSAQSNGDYKSNGTGGGAWNNAGTWLLYNGTTYLPAATAPSGSSGNIIVQGTDAVTISTNESINTLSINAGATLSVTAGKTLTLGADITANGTLSVSGTLWCGVYFVGGTGTFTLSSGATLNIGSAGGISSSGTTGNIQTTTRNFSTGANYTYTSSAAQITGNGLPTGITGVVKDNNTNATSGLTASTTVTVTAPGSFVVGTGYFLTCTATTHVTGSGSFTLNNGATFFIGSNAGISTTAATGNVQVTGTKTFDPSANYVYNSTSAQNTGNAFPTTLTGTLTVNNTSGSGCLLTSNLTVNSPGQVVVNGALACGTNVISGSGSFLLNAGSTLLTAHPLGIDATGATGSIQCATFAFPSTTNYTFYGASQVTGTGLPATVTSLYINSGGTVSLTADVTMNGTLTLNAGTFCLNGKTLIVPNGRTISRNNGTLSLCGGSLNFSGTVNVTYLGSGTLTTGAEIPPSASALLDVTINGKTVTLGQNITVNTSLTMTAGTLLLGSYALTYSPSAKLIYNGTAAQATGIEWPDAAFDRNVQISNTHAASGVALSANKTAYTGTLTVMNNGFFNSGSYSLYGTGNIAVNAGGTYITPHAAGVSTSGAIQLSGTRTFATGSSYSFTGTALQVTGGEMPASVANITVNNTSGAASAVTLTNVGSNTQTITGTLSLVTGVFDAAANNMNLIFQTGNIPLSRTAGSLTFGAANNLQFGSAGSIGGAAFTLPNSVFTTTPVVNNLTVNRTNTLTLGNQDFTVNGTLTLTAGVLDLNSTTLTLQNGNTPISVGAGSLTAGSNASLRFGTVGNTSGTAFSLPNNLFTSTPALLNFSVNRTNALTLGTQNITVGGALTLASGTVNIAGSTLGLNGTISVGSGLLNGGTNSSISVGGSGTALTLPAIGNGLNNLTVSRANVGSTPAVNLGADLSMTGLLDLSGGSVALGTQNLTLASTGSIANAANGRYIVTANNAASGGYLIRYAGASAVSFPVGTATYTPVSINNSGGTADNFRVRVFDGVLNNGTSGSSYGNLSHTVNKTWVVEEATIGGSNAAVTVQWNTGDENVSFIRGASYVSQNNGAGWDTQTATTATTVSTGVYSRTRSGINSFMPLMVEDNNIVLPLKFLGFTAARVPGAVDLKWATGSESAPHSFAIERSFNGSDFESVGKVDGYTNTATTASYSYSDGTAPPSRKIYYRIKHITTGGSGYSDVRRLSATEKYSFSIYPQPAESTAILQFESGASGVATVNIYNAAGLKVKAKAIVVAAGLQKAEMNVQDLPRGIYLIRIEQGNSVSVGKMVK